MDYGSIFLDSTGYCLNQQKLDLIIVDEILGGHWFYLTWYIVGNHLIVVMF